MDQDSFANGLGASAETRATVAEILRTAERDAVTWSELPGLLGPEIDRFEREQIATGYARVHGGNISAIDRRQDFLVRTAVTSIVFPLEAFDDWLPQLIEKRGLAALSHTLVREFAASAADLATVFETSGACRIAAFAIEDLLRDSVKNPLTPAELVAKRNGIIETLWERVSPDEVPHGWSGIALFWVTSLIGLGGLTDTNTTEHFYDG